MLYAKAHTFSLHFGKGRNAGSVLIPSIKRDLIRFVDGTTPNCKFARPFMTPLCFCRKPAVHKRTNGSRQGFLTAEFYSVGKPIREVKPA